MMTGFEGAESDAIREMLPAAIAEICDPEIEFVETPERVTLRDGKILRYREFYDESGARAALGS